MFRSVDLGSCLGAASWGPIWSENRRSRLFLGPNNNLKLFWDPKTTWGGSWDPKKQPGGGTWDPKKQPGVGTWDPKHSLGGWYHFLDPAPGDPKNGKKPGFLLIQFNSLIHAFIFNSTHPLISNSIKFIT